MTSVLITGTDRRLGLELVGLCSARGWRVLATCRDPGGAEDLRELACQGPGLLSSHRLDVTAPEQIADFADEIQEEPVDLGVNYAGVYFERWGNDPIGSIGYEAWLDAFRVNTLGPMRVTYTS